MLAHKDKKALILRLRDPERVTSVIPKARIFEHEGKQYVAVKHGVDEAKVLRNIGIAAPSPINTYYSYPGRFPPFPQQRNTAAFLTLHNRAFNLGGMGTGKTLSTLWAYDYLRGEGLVKKAIVITPLSTLERTWADTVFEHFPHLTTSVLYGSRERRLKLLETDADIYLINHDGIKVSGFIDAMKERADIDLVIIDEIAQVARNAGTDRYKALTAIVNKQAPRRAWGLTGTPTPNGPTDAWAQCRLITPEKVPPYFNRFRDSVMRQVNTFLWVPRDNATEVVHDAMQPAIRYSLEECVVGMPECIYETRGVELTAPQQKAYKEMLVKLKTEAEEGQILAVNEAVKAQKLLQIACGVVYGSQGEEIVFDATPRMDAILEAIEEAGTKIIVFAPFVSVVKAVSQFLTDKGISNAMIISDTSKSARDDILGAFQRSQYPHVLVASPGTMSHGLTLTAANTIIWAAPIASNDIFEQANARVRRPGQKHPQLIVMVEGTPIERRYYARLKEKQRVQGILLDMVQSSRISA